MCSYFIKLLTMIEKKLIFFVVLFVAKIAAHPFFDERSEKLTALKVAEELEEKVQTEEENQPEESSKQKKRKNKKGIEDSEENEGDEDTIEATLGPDSEAENVSDKDLAEPDDPEIVKSKKERRNNRKKKNTKKRGANDSDNSSEDGDDMNVDPMIDPAIAPPVEYSTQQHIDPFTASEGPSAYTVSPSTEGPLGYTGDDVNNDDNDDATDDDNDDDDAGRSFDVNDNKVNIN